jgi:AraC-like DNA-binding protein
MTAPGRFKAELTRIELHNLWMQRARIALPSVTYSAVHKDRMMIFFLLDEEQAPIVNSGMEVSQADLLRYSQNSEHHYRTHTSYHCGGMSVSPATLARVSRALIGAEVSAPAVSTLVRPPPKLMARLRQLHKAAGALAVDAPDIIAHPEVARAMEDELIRAMVACITQGVAVTRERPGRVPVMRRFEQVLEAHAGEPLYLSELCAEIGVFDRALRRHCQERLGMRPQQYLWLRRMNITRRALAHADPSRTTVTAIATEHGFGELGRFSVQYRKLFGESPSNTLHRSPDEPRPVAINPPERVQFPGLR